MAWKKSYFYPPKIELLLRKEAALFVIVILTAYSAKAQLSPAELEERKREKLLAVPQSQGHGRGGAPEQDCNGAIVVCQGSFYQPSAYSGYGTAQEVPISSCLANQEKNSAWYFFSVETSGTLTFTIDPNDNNDDYDFAFYNLSGRTCSDIISGAAPEVRCNFCVEPGNTGISSSGANASEPCCTNPGCQFSSILNVTAGQSFALIVSNYSSSQSGYNLTFGGTTTIFDNIRPTPNSVSAPCGANFLTLKMSESVVCDSITSTGSEFTITGPGGPFTVNGASGIYCGISSAEITVNFTPPLITNSNYTITINNGSDNNTLVDNCANSVLQGSSLNFAAVPTPPYITGPDSVCKGSAATLTASQGTSYTWNTGATTQTIVINPLANTTYSVTVANGLCSGSNSHTVNVKESPVANFTYSPLVICAGQQVSFTNATIPAQICIIPGFCIPSPLTTYAWTFGAGQGNSTAANPVHTYNTPGIYNVTLLASDFFSSIQGCSNSKTVTITVLANGGTLTVSNDTSVCEGESVTLTASGSSTYTWTSRPPGFSATTATINISPTVNTTYIVTSPGCSTSSTDSVRVTVTAAAVTISPSNPAICNGDFVTLTASGNNLVNYTWSPATGLSATSGSAVDANPTATTVYNVIATTASGCASAGSVTVTVNQNPVPVITSSGPIPFCTGDSVILDAGAEYITYVWNTGETSPTITVDSAGTFSVTVFDNSGCSGNASIVTSISNSLNPVITGPSSICPGSSTTLDAGGGYSGYSWSTSELTQTIVTTQAGTFTVTVTSGSCSGVSQPFDVIVSQNLNPSISVIGANPFCPGDSVLLIADAGYATYSWSTGAALDNITVKQADVYDVSVTDNFGCSGTSQPVSITVYNNPVPVITPQGPITFCTGSSIDLDAGSFSSYSWSTGAVTQMINVSQDGSYDVTVTDSNGCEGISTPVTVTVVAALTPVITSSGQVCAGGTVTLDAAAGYSTYSWSTSETLQMINVTQEGDYMVTVADADGCEGISSPFTVSFLPVLTPAITSSGQGCAGGTVTLEAGAGYSTYSWSTGDSVQAIDALQDGDYDVTVADAGGCSGTDAITLVFFENPIVTLNDTCQLGKGIVAPVVNNGTPPFSYLWTNGSTEEVLDALDAGNYGLTVTDANTCTATTSIAVACPIEITYVTVPSAFSPNGDGKNDFLAVLGDKTKIRFYEFGIFNRWGQKVFFTDDLSLISETPGSSKGWDGYFQGKAQDIGVFSYFLDVEFLNGNMDNVGGSITLVR